MFLVFNIFLYTQVYNDAAQMYRGGCGLSPDDIVSPVTATKDNFEAFGSDGDTAKISEEGHLVLRSTSGPDKLLSISCMEQGQCTMS